MKTIASSLIVGVLFTAGYSAADPIEVPLPIDSPVSIDLNADPVVTFGTRTIDFTPNLDQEFIAFLPSVTEVPGGFRSTIGVRARDGLSELAGFFPLSPVPGFLNQVPMFSVGTTDLMAFDVITPGWGTPFSVSMVDQHGDPHSAMFANPVPEPTSLLLVGSALGLLAGARQRAKRRI
jgi:PEP-CTERM motif